MTDYFFDLKGIFPYIYSFPIFLLILVVLFLILRRNIDNKSVSFYGMFMSLSKRDILSISLLLLFFYIVVVSIFINDISVMLFSFCIPVLVLNIINFYVIKFFVDIINSAIIFALLYLKVFFFNYIVTVGNYWYVIMIYILMCIFIVMYTVFILTRRFKSVLSNSKYVK